MSAFVRHTVLMAIAIALGTMVAGWWTVPLIAAMWTFAFPRRAAILSAAFAAIVAWSALLALASRSGPIGELADLLAQVLGITSAALLAVTLAYAGLLAGAAALLAQAIRPAAPPL
jgi:hypothetical protein